MKLFTLLVLLLTTVNASAAPPTDAELQTCIGEASGTLPVFSQLKRGMKPADVAAIYPGADKLDKYNFAKVKAKDCAGAKTFELHYQKDRKTDEILLYNATIEFDKALTRDEDFYKRLTTLLVGKYGPVKDEDIAKKILTWGTKEGVVQLSALSKKHPFKLKAPLVR
ncbi:MAG: hypothetical protein M4D80_08910 [Myxococcota bacterium]|nr:hypothetical protein [Deltaproteobacteria bacterium]MDQ3335270.1 hypothetical protein [Myxococcota bacterium]